MKFSNLRLLPLLVLVFALPSLALAGPPPGGTGSAATPSIPTNTPVNEYQGLGIDRHTASYSGAVLGIDDKPIADTEVQVFVNGVLTATALTDASGQYDMKATFDQRQDATILMWFVAPDPTLIPKEVVLAESAVSKRLGIISPCIARATQTSGRQFRIYLFGVLDRNKELAELNCLP